MVGRLARVCQLPDPTRLMLTAPRYSNVGIGGYVVEERSWKSWQEANERGQGSSDYGALVRFSVNCHLLWFDGAAFALGLPNPNKENSVQTISGLSASVELLLLFNY